MKKLMAMIVLAVFLVSMIPAALAQDGASDINAELNSNEDNGEATPVAISARPKLISAEKPVLKSVAVRRIQEMNKEQFREEKELLLQKAIDKCEGTDDPEACEEKLRLRVEQIQKIGTAALTRV
ncbi:MAG: hypothetical protein KAI26_06770, partial [Nanoarchaeota archaeon]|nr:hypothetical protein [Nanoarchaeota archaeon]